MKPRTGKTSRNPFSRRASRYYVGSFDDEILRHQNGVPDVEAELHAINETLSQAALFGGPLLINDGQLLLTEAGRTALLYRQCSPLLDLMKAGYVQLYSRNGDPKSLPKLMAPTVPTYAELLKNPGWPELYNQLDRLTVEVDPDVLLFRWPKLNTGPGFQRLLNQALERLKTVWNKGRLSEIQITWVQEQFNDRMTAKPDSPARTVFRELCESKHLNLDAEAMGQLHWMALEAYHYNLAIVSSAVHPDKRTGVITRYSHLFPEYRDPAMRPERGGAGLEEIPRPALPRRFGAEALHDGRLLREVVDEASELCALKGDYLCAVDRALKDKDRLAEAAEAAQRYAGELQRWLGSKEKHVPVYLLHAVEAVSAAYATVHLAHLGGGDGVLAHAAGNAAQIAAKGATVWVANRFATASGRMTAPLAVDLLDSLPDFSHDLAQVDQSSQGSHWFAFLSLNEEASREHLAGLPEFKN